MREGCRRVEAPSGNGLDGRSVGGRRIPERFTIALPPARDVKLLLTILSYFEARGPAAGRGVGVTRPANQAMRSEEHPSELQSLMRISYAVFCLKTKKKSNRRNRRQ